MHLSACTDDEGDNDDGQPNMKYKWQCVYFMRCLPPPTSLIDWPIHIPRLMTYLVQLMHYPHFLCPLTALESARKIKPKKPSYVTIVMRARDRARAKIN